MAPLKHEQDFYVFDKLPRSISSGLREHHSSYNQALLLGIA